MAYKNSVERGIEIRGKMYEAIVQYIKEHGYSPTVQEIGDMVGLKSKSSVHSHLKVMMDEGVIETDAGFSSPRAIRIPGYIFIKEAEVRAEMSLP